jgi:hypothetical protein
LAQGVRDLFALERHDWSPQAAFHSWRACVNQTGTRTLGAEGSLFDLKHVSSLVEAYFENKNRLLDTRAAYCSRCVVIVRAGTRETSRETAANDSSGVEEF